MSLVDTMGKLEDLLIAITSDLNKVRGGNKSAAQRVRVKTLGLEKIGKRFRKESVRVEKLQRVQRVRKKIRKKKRRF